MLSAVEYVYRATFALGRVIRGKADNYFDSCYAVVYSGMADAGVRVFPMP